MIHVIGANKTLTDLEEIEVQHHEGAGRAWKALPHAKLVKAIKREALKRGWEATNEAFATNDTGTEMVGALDIQLPESEGVPRIKGFQFGIGIVNANNQRKAMKLVVGGTVKVCCNGLVTGEIVCHKKHTKGTDLKSEIREALDQYVDKAKEIKALIQHYKDNGIRAYEVDHLMVEAGRRNLMPWSRLRLIDKEYQKLNNEEESAWRVLNAFTAAVKVNPPIQQIRQMDGFRALLDQYLIATSGEELS